MNQEVTNIASSAVLVDLNIAIWTARNNDKRVYAYLLTPKGIAEKAALTARFLRRKMDEYDALKAEIAQLQAELTGDARSRGGFAANTIRAWDPMDD